VLFSVHDRVPLEMLDYVGLGCNSALALRGSRHTIARFVPPIH
jgi:hypothetical protein